MRTTAAALTDIGRVREHNEDGFLSDPPLFAVADGMGGHESGEIASALALETICDAGSPGRAPIDDWLARSVTAANRAIFAEGTLRGGMLRMGTTLTTAYVADDAIYIAHVGDSRGYLLQKTGLRQVTDDHSLVAEWVREGRITQAEALVHPQRSVITRALGIDTAVEVASYRVVPSTGDRLLLCSDGLSGFVPDDAIESILRESDDLELAVNRLVDLANLNGGEDNITVVLFEIMDDPRSEARVVGSAITTATANMKTTEMSSTRKTDTDAEPVATNVDAPPTGEAGSVGTVGLAVNIDEPDDTPTPRNRRLWLKIGIPIGAVVIVIVGGWIGFRWIVSNSYYVGVDNGRVAVYEGLPESVLGIDTSRLQSTTDIVVSDLPTATQKNLDSGIKTNSLADSDNTVSNLRTQVTTTTAPPTSSPAPPPQ